MNYLAVDIGGSSVKAAVIDCGLMQNSAREVAGGIVFKSVMPSGRGDELLDALIDQIGEIMSAYNISAIGVGAPGLTENGEVKFAPNLDWSNIPLQKILTKRLNVRVKVINDAQAAAMGEKRFGAGVPFKDIVMLTLGTGVGGAYVGDTNLNESGGELGHIIIKQGGEKCGCGMRGCLEAYASASALVRETKKAAQSKIPTIIKDMPISGVTPFKAEALGDSEGARIIREYVENLAAGIISLNNIFRPQAFVLGGGVANEGENLLKRLREYLSGCDYGFKNAAPPKILTAKLGGDAAFYGLFSLLGFSN